MKKLQEIVQVVNRKRMKKIELFNESGPANRKSLYYRLYKGVKEGKFRSDEEAARELFGTDPSDKKYLMLKSRVKTRLLNSLFFLEKSKSRYQQAIYKCNRNLVASRFLLLNGARSTALSLVRSTLHEAEKFHLTDVALACLRILRYQASFMGNESDFRTYNARFKEVREVMDAEYLTEEYHQLITVPFGKSSSSKPELEDTVFEYLAEVERLRENVTSYNIELNYFRLKVAANQIVKNHHDVIEACLQAEAYLDANKELTQNIRYGEFAFYRMVAYMHLGEYEAGKRMAAKYTTLYREGSVNWMIFLEYYFLLCMHTRNYRKAAEIYRKVVGHKRFQHIDETRKEKWKIFEAFLKYMMGANIDLEVPGDVPNRFNIWKFLNEVPIYSRDKRGLNIAIIILQVLFLLDRRDFDGIIQRAEALKVYCSRYLKQDENFRSNCFLKMLLIMEKKDFNYERTVKIAEKYYTKLKSSRFDYQRGNLATLEIIPYEQLWDTILQKLQD